MLGSGRLMRLRVPSWRKAHHKPLNYGGGQCSDMMEGFLITCRFYSTCYLSRPLVIHVLRSILIHTFNELCRKHPTYNKGLLTRSQ